jgi:transketolase
MTDLRDALFDAIYALAAEDQNIVFLSADADAFSLRKFRDDFPERYVNVGVAEQNMVNLATGLALSGKRVFIYAILSFVTMRCFEQIKFNLCGMNLPVTLIGVGAGFGFDFDGPSHHGVHDIALMRTLPEMEILNLSTASMADKAAGYAHRCDHPLLLRLDKGSWPERYGPDFHFQGWAALRQGGRVCVASTGVMVHRVMEVADALADAGHELTVLDLYRLQPVDEQGLAEQLAAMDCLVTVEENALSGALATLCAELIARRGLGCRLVSLAVADEQTFLYGSRDWLQDHYGLSGRSLRDAIASQMT